MESIPEEARRFINGVNVDKLEELKATFDEDPDLATLSFHATNEWVEGAQSRTTVQRMEQAGQEIIRDDPFVLQADQPKMLLGNDTAPNAIVSLLHALASSLSVAIVYHAAIKNMVIEKLSIFLEGDLDVHGFLGMSTEVRPGFQDLRVRIDLLSPAPREEVEELVRYAQKVSPILDSLRNRIPLEVVLS